MNSWDKARDDIDKLTEYFSSDARFDFVGFIAHGSYGSASRVRYKNPATGDWNNFVVKRAFSSEAAEEAMRLEKDYLMRFRGALHIVQILDVANNPLAVNPVPGEWITMEWLPYGSLSDFIFKTKKKKVDHLPNRLLWRFFLCLVLGEPPDDFEHTITPILKVIDFGNAGEWSWIEFTGTTTHSNLWDIGKLMVSLIILDERPYVVNLGLGEVAFPERGILLTTDADKILPLDEPGAPYPWLDPQLGKLVAWCLASEPADRPSLWDIGNEVGFAVGSKQAAAYPNRPEEENDNISQLWRRIVLDADT
ncbi:hypothetical protein GL218_08420 [Daldinia childiae]|uniref:uncharacterized protein n=1 Tax=Daldinia childiae TaxID=326645 RepID=UPI0014478C04|nr:uncharacterized protein GL218_08420 [Daldinia childiae]KAF3068344.1 hypothetical protein GL218_08420 [Daldinia childiae]